MSLDAEEMSLRDTLEAAVAEHAAEPAEKPAEAATEAGERPRDEKGRFTSTSGETAPEANVAAPAANPAAKPVPNDPEAVLGVKAPDSVPADLREKFTTLPEEWQQYLTRREADIHKQFTRQDDERQFGRSLRSVIEPYMPMITAEGGNAVEAVRSLFNTAYVLRTASPEQKTALFHELAKQYNVELSTAPPQSFVDPALETLQQRLDRLERERQAEAQARAMEAQRTIAAEIETFKANAPHFDTVRDRMAKLLEAGAADSLQDAYDQAVWADPNIRSTLLAERQKEAAAQAAAKAQAEAEAKKRAAVSVSGAPGGATPSAADPNRSLRDEIAAQMAAAQGRL